MKHNTVDRLKQIILGFNDQCGTNFTRAGKKQELIDRITRELDIWRRTQSGEKWLNAKTILNSSRTTMYVLHTQTALSQLCGVPDYLLRLTQFVTRYNPYVNGSYGVSSAAHFGSSSIPSAHYPPRPSSSIPPYDPYAPPRRPVVPPAATASTSSAPGRPFMEHAMHSLMSFQPYSSSIPLFSAWIGPSLLLLSALVCAYISVMIS